MALSITNMRFEDSIIFKEAAVQYNCWVLVRHTNPKSLRFIGINGFIPKPIECKAKTAKQGGWANKRFYDIAGLVASPELLDKTGIDMNAWKTYKNLLDDLKFTLEENINSPYYGCLRLHGKYIHGDYDLFDIIPTGHERRNFYVVGEELNGQDHNRGPRLGQIKQFVNQRIGSEMVQHGGNAQYSSEYEAVYAFNPDPLDQEVVYSWDEYQTRLHYEKAWSRPLAGMSRDHLKG